MKPKREKNKTAEELQFDNELRKVKMTLEQGVHFGGGGNLPPEIESDFLDNIEAFEKQYKNCKRITV